MLAAASRSFLPPAPRSTYAPLTTIVAAIGTALGMMGVGVGGCMAQSGEPHLVRIGDVNSYHSPAQLAVLEHYYKGMELAVAQINAAGGVAGKKLHLTTRDDQASAEGARRAAADLWDRAGVDILIGSCCSGDSAAAARALSEQARQRQRLFLAVSPLNDLSAALPSGQASNGQRDPTYQRYIWQLRPPLSRQIAALIPEAVKLQKKRWAIVHPDDELGRSAAQSFQAALSGAQPDVQWVLIQAVPSFALSNDAQADALAQALRQAQPEAIFNSVSGADLLPWVQAGQRQGLFAGRNVVSVLAGEPESLDRIKDAPPEGWIVTGYPWYAIDANLHDGFFTAYRKRFKDYPRTASVLGYSAIESIVAALRKTAGQTDNTQLAQAFEHLAVQTPWGPITYRAHNHQSTLGTFVGTTGLLRGKGAMVRFRYAEAADVGR